MTAPSQLYKFVYIDNLINRSVEIQLNRNRETMTRISYPIDREKDMYFFLYISYEIKNSDIIICFLISSNSKLFLQKSLSTLSSWYSKYSELTYRINYSHQLDLSISLPRSDVCFVHFRLFGKTITNILIKWYGVLFFSKLKYQRFEIVVLQWTKLRMLRKRNCYFIDDKY